MQSALFSLPTEQSVIPFVRSYLGHYDCNTQGRYTHEYHPLLLDKAAESMDTLEHRLSTEGFSLVGHIIIAGYEEQAVPSYYTDYARPEIQDEASMKGRAGQAPPPHNLFGLMTGFLFKECDQITAALPGNKKSLFHHINPEHVEIFDERGTIFQQDAFGDFFDELMYTQEQVAEKMKEGDTKGVLKTVTDFWYHMYRKESRSGAFDVIATQDILFSIQYARHLMRSSAPLLNYYTGADITYPIEISLVHQQGVTHNAQLFVQRFFNELRPLNNEKTAYVFCSFVDGVGKSTMLGNIKNWITHRSNVVRYEHVDNSSSQYADIYPVHDDVIVVDLPAQMSHFTYKPDGMVYVDLGTTIGDKKKAVAVEAYVRTHHKELERSYTRALSSPTTPFLENVRLLHQEKTNEWIPFTFDGDEYLYHKHDFTRLRIMVPLTSAPSHGLKNAEASQMIFSQGISLPMGYQYFLDDLIEKLKRCKSKQVVFVNFMSMYPRSCRENIRVNYILQQLALLDPTFMPSRSFYDVFLDDAHLYYLFKHKHYHDYAASLTHETLVRLALYTSIMQHDHKTLVNKSRAACTEMIKKEIDQLSSANKKYTAAVVAEKLKSEYCLLKERYEMTKEYENVYQYSAQSLLLFSDCLERFFRDKVEYPYHKKRWHIFGNTILIPPDATTKGPSNRPLKMDNGCHVQHEYCCEPGVKNKVILEPLAKMLRSAWYATLWSLLEATEICQGKIVLPYSTYPLLPMVVKQGCDEKLYVVHEVAFDVERRNTQAERSNALVEHGNVQWNGDNPARDYSDFCVRFNLPLKDARWVEKDHRRYYMSWSHTKTDRHIFGFDSDLARVHIDDARQQTALQEGCSLVTSLIKQYRTLAGTKVISTSELYRRLAMVPEFSYQCSDMLDQARKNKLTEGLSSKALNENDYDMPSLEPVYDKKRPYYTIATKEQEKIACFVVRALATLEMILKDVHGDVVVRKHNKEDFVAALKLFECLIIPRYSGLVFERPLFQKYDEVEPLIQWNYITEA